MSKIFLKIANAASSTVIVFGIIIFTLTSFLVGFVKGYAYGINGAVSQTSPTSTPSATVKIIVPRQTAAPKITWGGPQLWEAVNKRRVELGVNPLSVRDELCTIASIRLNQILELGKLDGHAGFAPLADRADLKWIFEKYNLSEFLVSGATSPQDAVSLWENTLGHKELLSGGQYVWGCIYAQNGFGVAIAAY